MVCKRCAITCTYGFGWLIESLLHEVFRFRISEGDGFEVPDRRVSQGARAIVRGLRREGGVGREKRELFRECDLVAYGALHKLRLLEHKSDTSIKFIGGEPLLIPM